MVCSLKWQRSARPSGLQPWNCGRFFRDKNIDFPAMEWLLSLPTTHTHKHTLHSYFTSVHCLIFCLFVLRALISPMTAWHRCRVLKPARNKSIDWFPEGNLVSTLSRSEALLLPSLPKLIGGRSHQTSRSLPHRRRTVLSSSAATRSSQNVRREARPANSKHPANKITVWSWFSWGRNGQEDAIIKSTICPLVVLCWLKVHCPRCLSVVFTSFTPLSVFLLQHCCWQEELYFFHCVVTDTE